MLGRPQIGSNPSADGRGNPAENLDRPRDLMVTFQDVQHLLLRVVVGEPADTLGQGRGGIPGDNAQAELQRREGRLLVVAGFLQRLVQTPLQLNRAEQGSDAAAVAALGVSARVVLAVTLRVFGSVLGLLRLDVVDDGLNHEAATLGKELLKGGLEVESRTGSDRRREEAGDEGEHLLAEGQAGVAGLLERGLKLRENSSSHGEAEDARLSHGGCLSRQGNPDRVVRGLAISFLGKSASFFHPLWPSKHPNPTKPPSSSPISLVSPEWSDGTRTQGRPPVQEKSGAGWVPEKKCRPAPFAVRAGNKQRERRQRRT